MVISALHAPSSASGTAAASATATATVADATVIVTLFAAAVTATAAATATAAVAATAAAAATATAATAAAAATATAAAADAMRTLITPDSVHISDASCARGFLRECFGGIRVVKRTSATDLRHIKNAVVCSTFSTARSFIGLLGIKQQFVNVFDNLIIILKFMKSVYPLFHLTGGSLNVAGQTSTTRNGAIGQNSCVRNSRTGHNKAR